MEDRVEIIILSAVMVKSEEPAVHCTITIDKHCLHADHKR